MSEPPVDSKIVIPIVPTFFHLALVKVAVPLFYKYGSDALNTAMTDIQLQNLPASFNAGIPENRPINCNRAKEALLFIPAHLRRSVVEAANGLESELFTWLREHQFLKMKNENIDFWKGDFVFWKCDGTVDRIKTAQELVLNKNISLGGRFTIACQYSLKERIEILWTEKVASGETENYIENDDSIENAWIEWIRGEIPSNWTRAVLRESKLIPFPWYSSFFSSLQPEDRKKALALIYWQGLHLDDLRFCLSAMNDEEREKVIKMNADKILSLFSIWPLQNHFLEVAEKVKNYIDYDAFRWVLVFIKVHMFIEDFDYCKMIVGFWQINPHHYETLLKEDNILSNELHQYIEENKLPKIRYVGPRQDFISIDLT